jgi:hypothetical protein
VTGNMTTTSPAALRPGLPTSNPLHRRLHPPLSDPSQVKGNYTNQPRPDPALVSEHRPRPAGTGDGRYPVIGAVVHVLAIAIQESRDPSAMSGILADTAYRLLQA